MSIRRCRAIWSRNGAEFLSSFPHAGCEDIQHRLSVIPAYAGVGYGDAVFQAGFAFFGDFLVTCGFMLLAGLRSRSLHALFIGPLQWECDGSMVWQNMAYLH